MTGVPSKRPAFEPASELLKPVSYDPDMQRPASTVAGALLVFLRVVSGLFVLLGILLDWQNSLTEVDVTIDGVESTPETALAALIGVVIVLAVVLVVDAALAWFILSGRNWARVTIMTLSAISISGAFLQWWTQGQEIRISGSLLTLGLDILILLALSSRSAAAYARRNERR